jgi:hypothetical protein
MKERIVVLGCGPAGMIAAHAASLMGHDVSIISDNPQPSTMFGAQYLHAPIPKATDGSPRVYVNYVLQGTNNGYKRKVYGALGRDLVSSPDALAENHSAWDIRYTYNRLWEMYGDRVTKGYIDGHNIDSIKGKWDVIISSIPKISLCSSGFACNFKSVEVWASGEAPEWGKHIDINCPDNTVICNGRDLPTWYRVSNIYGRKTIEWGFAEGVGLEETNGAALVRKPISNDCECHPEILRVGRYGKWQKGVLASDSFDQVTCYLRRRARGNIPAQPRGGIGGGFY